MHRICLKIATAYFCMNTEKIDHAIPFHISLHLNYITKLGDSTIIILHNKTKKTHKQNTQSRAFELKKNILKTHYYNSILVGILVAERECITSDLRHIGHPGPNRILDPPI